MYSSPSMKDTYEGNQKKIEENGWVRKKSVFFWFSLLKRGPSAKPKKAGQKKEVRIRLVAP